MGELIADIFLSLDGFAGGESFGPFFGYGGPDLDRWIEDHRAEPQQLVLGRRTYHLMGGQMTDRPKLVISNTLTEPLEWANATLLRGDAVEALTALKQESEVPLRTMGSLTLVRSLLGAGVLDRLRLTVFPLIAGSRGQEPFFADLATHHLTLDRQEVLDNRILALEYRP